MIVVGSIAVVFCWLILYVIVLRIARRARNKKDEVNANEESILFTSEAIKYRGNQIDKLSARIASIAVEIAREENVRLIDIPMMERAFQKAFKEEIAKTKN